MKTSIIDWVMECIETENKFFAYEKGKYIHNLLKIAINKGHKTKQELLDSPFSFLVNKPEFKQITKNVGSRCFDSEVINWPIESQKSFRLTIGRWGKETKHCKDNYYQTSCPGENLVLQLNFDLEHDVLYHQTFKIKEDGHNFTNDNHPIALKSNTLAWSRIDFDLETGEAFIEEIQNDWLRQVFQVHEVLKERKKQKREHWITYYTKEEDFEQYVEFLKPYKAYWSELMLMATIDFIVKELGIKKVYYHSYESGNYFKGINYNRRPPVSLYTKLPKQFGFQKTKEIPQFWIANSYMKKRIKNFEGELFSFQF